jgi:hypothetical protein
MSAEPRVTPIILRSPNVSPTDVSIGGAYKTIAELKAGPEFAAALAQASEEAGLQDYYQDCVRPLFSMPISQWPTCCGGGCQPCSQTLIAVAERMCTLLHIDPLQLR